MAKLNPVWNPARHPARIRQFCANKSVRSLNFPSRETPCHPQAQYPALQCIELFPVPPMTNSSSPHTWLVAMKPTNPCRVRVSAPKPPATASAPITRSKPCTLITCSAAAVGGCVPGAGIEVLPSKFAACEVWNANKKLGQYVAYLALDRCIELADQYGIGQVCVDNAFHYLWGGGYVMAAAEPWLLGLYQLYFSASRGGSLRRKFPPSAPTRIPGASPPPRPWASRMVIDWATSVVAMGRVQLSQARRQTTFHPGPQSTRTEGPTTDPNTRPLRLFRFGDHKGYGLSLINETCGASIGGSLPTIASARTDPPTEKTTCAFFSKSFTRKRSLWPCLQPEDEPAGKRQGGDRRCPGSRQFEFHPSRTN